MGTPGKTVADIILLGPKDLYLLVILLLCTPILKCRLNLWLDSKE